MHCGSRENASWQWAIRFSTIGLHPLTGNNFPTRDSTDTCRHCTTGQWPAWRPHFRDPHDSSNRSNGGPCCDPNRSAIFPDHGSASQAIPPRSPSPTTGSAASRWNLGEREPAAPNFAGMVERPGSSRRRCHPPRHWGQIRGNWPLPESLPYSGS
ncbi:hypothetical protein EFBL_2102 [Effusibacillus lacus]|uniref:Uncharacterized protein n=1 Tax=Effusibacillus lacus TaxID=1348429 RepID=A0A292YPQ5_9BACL|nr:hypothetical protein EFBL_2102 [Effusibacillus lacus]